MRFSLRRAAVFLCLVILVAGLGIGAYRIVALNASTGDHRHIAYRLNEEAPFPSYSKSESKPHDSHVLITATKTFMIDRNEAQERFSDVGATPPPTSGSDDAKWIVAEVSLRNMGTTDASISLVGVNMQMGAWANGIDLPLFSAMNGRSGLTVHFASGETQRLQIPFSIDKTQFGFRGAGSSLEDREYDLVMATYPDEIAISLGKPGSPLPAGADGGRS